MRGEHRIEGTPYAKWDVQVEEQNRIRVSLSEISPVISWLDIEPGSIECIAMPGPAGGVQIEPFDSQETLRQRFIKAVRQDPPRSSESGQAWIEVARLLAAHWKLTINVEKYRINIHLPEPIRKGLQLPGFPGRVVVFGLGEILEVWDAVRWYEHIRQLSMTRSSSVQDTIEHLENK
jgi:hypothetical protein